MVPPLQPVRPARERDGRTNGTTTQAARRGAARGRPDTRTREPKRPEGRARVLPGEPRGLRGARAGRQGAMALRCNAPHRARTHHPRGGRERAPLLHRGRPARRCPARADTHGRSLRCVERLAVQHPQAPHARGMEELPSA